MHWIAPSEKDTTNAALKKRLWSDADASASEQEQIQNHRRTRDFLLSRLMSGEFQRGSKKVSKST